MSTNFRHRLTIVFLATGLFLAGSLKDFNNCTRENPQPLSGLLPANLETEEERLKPYDEPDQAAEHYILKRVPYGQNEIPANRYFRALNHMRRMNQYSTSLNTTLPPQSEMTALSAQLAALGTWQQLGPGNIGGRTRALLINPVNPNIMYAAGVAGGVWKTSNGGSSWTPLDDLLPNMAVCSMAMDPVDSNVIYAGTGEGFFNSDGVAGAGMFKTTDGGTAWTRLTNTSNRSFRVINDIVISPVSSQRIYAATNVGVFRSADGGLNWIQVLSPGVTGGCLDLAIRSDQATDFLFAACGTFTQATVYRNTDAGGAGTWTAVLTESGMGRTSLAIAPSNQDTIYALSASVAPGTFQNGLHAVFRSTGGGASGTWTAQVRNTNPTKLNTVLLTNPLFAFLSECGLGSSSFPNQGWYDNVIAVDPVDSNRVWAGGIDLFRSDDGGANWGLASYWWASTSDPHFAHADQHAIVFHPQYNGTTNKMMFVGNDGGIFRTNDARAALATGATAACNSANTSVTWVSINNNYGVTQFYHGAPYPDGTTYFGGTQDNGTLRGTDTSGPNSWSRILGGDGGYVAVDRTNTSILYGEHTRLSIRKSTNGGASFSSSINGITESSGNFLFINPFHMDPVDSQRLWTGGTFLWRTTNGAANWTQASTIRSGNGRVSAIAVAPTNPNNVLAGMSDGVIHRTNVGLTSDSSTVWPSIKPRNGFVSWVTFDPANANIAYATYSSFNAVSTDRHVYKSTDAGATWTGIDGVNFNGIPDVPAHSIVVDPNNTSRLYVGTDVGVFVSLDEGATWARENTGFANAVTESLAVNTAGGVTSLFAFTHGRGAWRVNTTPSCSSLSALRAIFPTSGGAGGVNVIAPGGCAWTAISNDSFINIISGSSGSGNGTVSFSVSPNPGPASRKGTITIGGETFTVHQAVDFADVPASHPFSADIGKIAALQITTGCGNGNFCPNQAVTRAQMAVFIERALGVFNPPAPLVQRFDDVPPSSFGYAFIDDLARRGITNGCGLNVYCPGSFVTRAQMAVFIERMLGVFDPPTPTGQTFQDVTPSSFGYVFIEDFSKRGITLGCSASPPLFCPGNSVTRAQMAAFLSRALGL